jgi:GTP-binding protein EngB required for normal cell division
VLIDVRRGGPLEIDMEFVALLGQHGIPVMAALTKCDRVPHDDQMRAALETAIAIDSITPLRHGPVLPTSAAVADWPAVAALRYEFALFADLVRMARAEQE